MSQPIETGVVYRTVYFFRFPPYPGDAFTAKLIELMIMTSNKSPSIRVLTAAPVGPAALAKLDIEGGPGVDGRHVPPEFKSGRAKPWALIVEWKRFADIQDGLAEGGVEKVVKFILIGLALGVAAITFVSFTRVANTAGDLAGRTLFNPGFVIAAMVIVAVIFGRR